MVARSQQYQISLRRHDVRVTAQCGVFCMLALPALNLGRFFGRRFATLG